MKMKKSLVEDARPRGWVTLLHVLWVLTCLSACDIASDAADDQTTEGDLLESTNVEQTPLEDDRIVCEDTASPAPLTIRFTTSSLVGTVPASSDLKWEIRNPRTTAISADIYLTAAGLDQREKEKLVASVTVNPGATVTHVLPFNQLPIQSVGMTSHYSVVARVSEGGVTRNIASTPTLHAMFSSNYANVTLYEYTDKDWAIGTPVSFADYWARTASLRAAQAALQGRVEMTPGVFTNYKLLAPVTSGGATLLTDVILHEDLDAAFAGAPSAPLPHMGEPKPNTYNLCAKWRARHTDSQLGEDYLLPGTFPLSTPSFPARYAGYEIYDSSGAFSGVLNANGCTGTVRLTPGTYYFRVSGAHKVGATTWHARYGLSSWMSMIHTINLAPVSNTTTINVTNTQHDNATRAAAVIAQMLNVADAGQGTGTFYVNANLPCDSAASSTCASGSHVYLGNNGEGVSDSFSKFIVAHEMGHVVQSATFGFPTFGYGEDPGGLCGCGHVGLLNNLHCLQSREQFGGAIVEGFAQFYASKVMNNFAQADCTMNYYKELFLDVDVFYYPPTAVSCRTPVRWMETHCLASNRGTEWDWMTFLQNINSATPIASRLTMGDISAVFQFACGGTKCNGTHNLKWGDLDTGAAASFGMLSPKYTTFALSGDSSGVNH